MTGDGTNRPRASRFGVQSIGQQQAAAVAGEADDAAGSRRATRAAPCGTSSGTAPRRRAGSRAAAGRPPRQRCVRGPRLSDRITSSNHGEPVEHVGDVGLAHGDEFGGRERVAHGADRRRGHHHVADPVRQEQRDPVHPCTRHAAFMPFDQVVVVENPSRSSARWTRPP